MMYAAILDPFRSESVLILQLETVSAVTRFQMMGKRMVFARFLYSSSKLAKDSARIDLIGTDLRLFNLFCGHDVT